MTAPRFSGEAVCRALALGHQSAMKPTMARAALLSVALPSLPHDAMPSSYRLPCHHLTVGFPLLMSLSTTLPMVFSLWLMTTPEDRALLLHPHRFRSVPISLPPVQTV
jgi:hypothetical protein